MRELETNSIRIRPAIFVLGCFVIGILLDRYFDLSWQFSLAIASAFIGVWAYCYCYHLQKSCVIALALSILFAGSFWHHGRWNWFPKNDVSTYCSDGSTPVCIRARIMGEGKHAAQPVDSLFDPIPRGERTTFRVAPLSIRNGSDWQQVRGISTLIVHQRIEHIRFGDEVKIVGTLASINKPTSPGMFDFQDYYRARNQRSVIHTMFGSAVIVEHRVGNFSNASVLSLLRSELNALIWKHVHPDQAGFATAILLGNREQLSPEQRDLFLETGTAHLLAISGLHVGILAGLFLMAYGVGLLNRRWALILTIAFVIFYAWLVEFRPPVSRAAILLTLFCFGRLIGRTGSEFNLLALAAFVVLVINPSDLFHLGPQLSFLAVSTLVLFKGWIFPTNSDDPIKRLIRNTRPWHVRSARHCIRICKQAVMVSGLIWLIGLPLVAANFHLVTPISLLVNPFVLLPIAIALFAGLGVCVFGFWLPVVADGLGFVCSVCLSTVSNSIQFAEAVNVGHWWTAGPTTYSLIVFYLTLLFLAAFLKGRVEIMAVFVFAVWLVVGWLVPFQFDKMIDRICQGKTNCMIVDVGHGSSTLIQMPYGQTILYDAGSIVSSNHATETVSRLLWSQQVEHVDAVVISHADLDHYNALPKLSDRFSIGVVYISFPMLEKKSDAVVKLFNQLRADDVPVRNLAWNDFVTLRGGNRIDVILPPEFGTGDNDNSDSIVLLIDANGRKIILPGDLEGNGMRLLLGKKEIDVDVVVMPHHGSKNSRPEEFIRWSSPELAIVSAGRKKLDRNVVKQIEKQGCNVLTTADSGTIQIQFSKKIQVSSWLNEQWVSLFD